MSTMTNQRSKTVLAAIALLLIVGCSVQAVKPATEAAAVEAVPTPAPVVIKPIDFCAPEQGAPFSYRKKVAILAADLRNPLDARDLPGLDITWSQLLQQRLNESGRLLAVDASDQHLHIGARQQEWIISLANRLDVQFVIAVRFHSLHTIRKQFGVGELSIPLPWMKRQIEAELIIFDGYYGTQIATVTHSALAEGDEKELVNPVNQPVLRGAFLDTPLGESMNTVLSSEVDDGLKKLACLPLMARVIKVMGDNVYISTRGASLIHPGDTLQLFRASGQIESRLGPIEIIKVYPESAVGVYKGEGSAPSFSERLRVRAW